MAAAAAAQVPCTRLPRENTSRQGAQVPCTRLPRENTRPKGLLPCTTALQDATPGRPCANASLSPAPPGRSSGATHTLVLQSATWTLASAPASSMPAVPLSAPLQSPFSS